MFSVSFTLALNIEARDTRKNRRNGIAGSYGIQRNCHSTNEKLN